MARNASVVNHLRALETGPNADARKQPEREFARERKDVIALVLRLFLNLKLRFPFIGYGCRQSVPLFSLNRTPAPFPFNSYPSDAKRSM